MDNLYTGYAMALTGVVTIVIHLFFYDKLADIIQGLINGLS